jgi:hypothetical protein
MFGACQPRQVTVPGTSYIYWDLFPAMGKPTLLAISAGMGAEVSCSRQGLEFGDSAASWMERRNSRGFVCFSLSYLPLF